MRALHYLPLVVPRQERAPQLCCQRGKTCSTDTFSFYFVGLCFLAKCGDCFYVKKETNPRRDVKYVNNDQLSHDIVHDEKFHYSMTI